MTLQGRAVGADNPGMTRQSESGYLSRMGSLYLRVRWLWGGAMAVLPALLGAVGFGVTQGWVLSAAGGIVLAHALGMKLLGLETVTSTIFVDLVVVHGAVLLMSIRGADHSLVVLVMIGAAVIIALFSEGVALVAAIGLNSAFGLLNMSAAEDWALGRLVVPFVGALFVVGLVTVLLGSFRTRLVHLEMARALTLGIATHELRNRLTGIVGVTEMINSGSLPADSPESAELLVMAHNEALEAAAVLDDLLTLSRTERGLLESDSRPTDISSIIDRVVTRSFPDGSGVVTEGVAEPVWARADGLRLGQVMRNLLDNAKRHGGPNVRVAVSRAGGQVSIMVVDDGDGVRPGDLPELFQPYRSGRVDTTPGSTGLGLWISRSLLRSMGGDLEYRRHSGHTVFEATLLASDPTE